MRLGCLLHWLEQDPTCPTCRRQLLKAGSEKVGVPSRSRTRDNASFMSWIGWSRLLQQNVDTSVTTAAENSQLESLAEQVRQYIRLSSGNGAQIVNSFGCRLDTSNVS